MTPLIRVRGPAAGGVLAAALAVLACGPRDGWVTSVAPDPRNSNVVSATYGNFGGAHAVGAAVTEWLAPMRDRRDGCCCSRSRTAAARGAWRSGELS